MQPDIKSMEEFVKLASYQPYYDVPNNDIPEYHSAVKRLNMLITEASKIIGNGREEHEPN